MRRALRWIGIVLLVLGGLGGIGWLLGELYRGDAPDRPMPLVEFPPPPPPPRWSQPPRYRVVPLDDGWQILDEHDRVVFLRGVTASKGALAPPFRPVPLGDPRPFEQWKTWGFNAVRLPVPWEALEPEPRKFSREHLDYLRWFADQAWRYGLAVVLVAHQREASRCLGGAGAPLWAHRPGLVPGEVAERECRGVSPPGILRRPRMVRWWADFLDNRWTPDDLSLQDHWIDVWQKVAEVLYNHPAILGYEALDGAPCFPDWMVSLGPLERPCPESLSALYRRFAQAIRNVDQDALVLLALPDPVLRPALDLDGFALERPDLSGIGLAAADPGRPGPGDTAPWRRADCGLMDWLTQTEKMAWERLKGPRVLVDHGVWPTRPGALAGLMHQAMDIEEQGASAFVGIPLVSEAPDGPRPRCTTAALVRPFPMRVAGTQVRWSFERTGPGGDVRHDGRPVEDRDLFTLTFHQGTSRAPTLVFLPRLSVFGDDPSTEAPEFTVDVSDGEWRWVPGEPEVLAWTTNPAVEEHRMEVRPWGGRKAPGNGVGPCVEEP